jgi:hypothetical protein
MMNCPGCQTALSEHALDCSNCGMRFDQDEIHIDWGAIDTAHARQRRSPASKIMPMLLWATSLAMLFWLASPYATITQYILDHDRPIDLRAHLNQNHNFPEVGSYVFGKELALGYKGAEWMRVRRFAITRQEMVYIQVIGAVCPYEMPRERCRRVLIEVPKSLTDFETFRPASAVNVEGRLEQITKTSEFAPLIPFLAREMHMDVDGAYLIAHGLRPDWSKDAWIFWGIVAFICCLLSFFVLRVLRS